MTTVSDLRTVSESDASHWRRATPLERIVGQRTSLAVGVGLAFALLLVGYGGNAPRVSMAIAAMYLLGLFAHVASAPVSVTRALVLGSVHLAAAFALSVVVTR